MAFHFDSKTDWAGSIAGWDVSMLYRVASMLYLYETMHNCCASMVFLIKTIKGRKVTSDVAFKATIYISTEKI